MKLMTLMKRSLPGVLGLVLSLGAAAQTQPDKIRLGDMAQSLNGIASRVMVAQGIDRKHGLAVEYSQYPTLDGLFTAIRGKQVDIGFGGWTAFSQFRANGVPISVVFPVGRGASLDVLVKADSPIRSLADLKDKKIASYAGAAGTATVLLRVVTSKYFGYDPANGSRLQYIGPGLVTSMLDKGEIDAGVLFDPLAAKAIASGKYRSIANLPAVYKEKSGEDFLWIALATNDDFSTKQSAALTRFVAAWVEAVDYVKANPAVVETYARQIGFDQAGAELLRNRVVADYVMEWDADRIRELNNFGKAANQVMGSGYLDRIPPESLVTTFVPRKR